MTYGLLDICPILRRRVDLRARMKRSHNYNERKSMPVTKKDWAELKNGEVVLSPSGRGRIKLLEDAHRRCTCCNDIWFKGKSLKTGEIDDFYIEPEQQKRPAIMAAE